MTKKKNDTHHRVHKADKHDAPAEATAAPEKPNYGHKGHPGWVDAGKREAADTKAQEQIESPKAQSRLESGEFKINDQVRCAGQRCTVTAVLDDGETLSLITVDGKHSFNAKASDVKPVKKL